MKKYTDLESFSLPLRIAASLRFIAPVIRLIPIVSLLASALPNPNNRWVACLIMPSLQGLEIKEGFKNISSGLGLL